MPNKTIYVADDDLPLFERAQTLAGGNLSAAIARALRRFVETESAHELGFDEVTLVVGPPGSQRKKRFFGARLIVWQHTLAGGMIQVFSVYRTRGGRYVVHRQERADWERLSDPEWWFDVENWKHYGRRVGHRSHGLHGAWHRGEASLEVYGSLDEIEPHVPPELFGQLRTGGNEPPLEDLDI